MAETDFSSTVVNGPGSAGCIDVGDKGRRIADPDQGTAHAPGTILVQ